MASPGTILAIGHLISEMALTGLEIKRILEVARATGKIPDEEWEKLFQEWDRVRAQVHASPSR